MVFHEGDPPSLIEHEASRDPCRDSPILLDLSPVDRENPLDDRGSPELRDQVREDVLARADHLGKSPRKPYLSSRGYRGEPERSRMPEDTSDRASKVYDAMKSAGMTTEDRMRDADMITKMVKLPKGMVLSALQELEAKGYAKRRAREKAAGYYLVK